MRKREIIGSILTFLAFAALLGTHVLASCLLAMGIVGSYGVSVRVLLRRRVGACVGATLASTLIAAAAISAGLGLVYAWSLVLGHPFLSSLSLWAAIFGGGASWALLATWFEERGSELPVLRAIYG